MNGLASCSTQAHLAALRGHVLLHLVEHFEEAVESLGGAEAFLVEATVKEKLTPWALQCRQDLVECHLRMNKYDSALALALQFLNSVQADEEQAEPAWLISLPTTISWLESCIGDLKMQFGQLGEARL